MKIDIEKEAREVEEELANDEEEFKSNLHNQFRILVGMVLIILMVSYILFDPNVRDVIAGLIESDTLVENTFDYKGSKIIFEHNTHVELRTLFKENQKTEFRVCLRGIIENNNYLVHDIIQPDVHRATVFQVLSDPCPENTIVDLHSHPYQKCVASQTDLKLLEKEKQKNPRILMAVMCTDNRMSFYG